MASTRRCPVCTYRVGVTKGNVLVRHDAAPGDARDCDGSGMGEIPQRAVLPGRGKVRVLSYDGNGMFTVLTNRDVKVAVHRDRLTFTK